MAAETQPPPKLADLRHAVQDWLDATHRPPHPVALQACTALRRMIGSFARTAKILAAKQPAARCRTVLTSADRAVRQTHLQPGPDLTAYTLSRILAQTLLDLIDLCESLARTPCTHPRLHPNGTCTTCRGLIYDRKRTPTRPARRPQGKA